VSTPKKVAFHTLGCKLNFAESSALMRQLEGSGFSKGSFEEGADIFVINSCSVTENADRECKTIVHRALRKSPGANVVVIGCYAQLKPDEIAAIEGVDMVLGASEKFKLKEYLETLPSKKNIEKPFIHSCEIDEVGHFENSYSFGERTRVFLKVQDGCDYACSYCTIPRARGKSRSGSIAQTVEQAQLLAKAGAKEIVLTGVNIGDFGIQPDQDRRTETFFELIQALDEVPSIERFRISSIEPNLLKNEIIDFVVSSKKFMPHFHIPLQSGSDFILKKMRRRYPAKLYRSRIEKIKKMMPHCCIGADVIVGFPGETEDHFNETFEFIQSLDISYLHVFTYSERNHTEAAGFCDIVPKNVRLQRNHMLRMLSQEKKQIFYQGQHGSRRAVLFESADQDGIMEGFTDNYVKVKTTFDQNRCGKITDVVLGELRGEYYWL
jgi:threonylcarbamoyladenosine tRNA methylthiotransferase MtaB